MTPPVMFFCSSRFLSRATKYSTIHSTNRIRHAFKEWSLPQYHHKTPMHNCDGGVPGKVTRRTANGILRGTWTYGALAFLREEMITTIASWWFNAWRTMKSGKGIATIWLPSLRSWHDGLNSIWYTCTWLRPCDQIRVLFSKSGSASKL